MSQAGADQRIAELEAQLENLQQQLMQAQRLSSVGALASSITHEFNNILTTVINYAKLGMRHRDAATRDKAFDKILTASQRASKITTGVLSYARRGSNRQELTNLKELVLDTLVLVEKDLQMHRVRLVTQLEEGVQAHVDACQLQQVILNLVINARQAMSGGGEVKVVVRRNPDENCAEIRVADTGMGIPAEKLQQIFRPFYTTKTADDQGQGGTGLGLSLAREVIEAHKGKIRVESAVGRGTTFILKLPLETPAEQRLPKAG